MLEAITTGEDQMTEHGLDLLDDPVATELLASTLPAHLAYTWTDGTPRVVPIWFHWTGAEIVMGTPPRAPKLHALRDGDVVCVTIDSTEWPYHVLSIRGPVTVTPVVGVLPEYALAAKRYFGEQGGSDWVAQFPDDFQMSRLAVRPTWVSIIDFATRLPSALSV
jgi:hypothetical protein